MIKEIQVIPDHRVLQGWMEPMALTGHKVQKETQVIPVRKDHREKKVIKGIPVIQDRRVPPGWMVPMVLLDRWVRKAKSDLRVLPGWTEPMVQLGR